MLAVRQLLEVLLSGEDMGNAQLYFSGVTSSGGQTQVTFDYLVDGIPVYFADGGSAVEVEITETTITAFRLRCRQYTLAEDDYTPLPLPQALAAASVYGEGGDARLTWAMWTTAAAPSPPGGCCADRHWEGDTLWKPID